MTTQRALRNEPKGVCNTAKGQQMSGNMVVRHKREVSSRSCLNNKSNETDFNDNEHATEWRQNKDTTT